jgi:ribonucleoside-diphosphate reductase alpha chain
MDFQPISDDAFQEKYAKDGEDRVAQRARVAKALASVEKKNKKDWEKKFAGALKDGFVPGGRIQSGAGTGLQVTLINCFVQPVEDSMNGIAEALRQAMLTLKAGGGVGYDFSPIRPKGALVKAVNAEASGPISFMRVFDRACETIESAGYRRGAQMGVLRVDHPDVREFIEAKYERGQLSNFNVSVGVTDEFMQAVEDDGYFELTHESEPSPRRKEATDVYFDADKGKWVYERVRAREIWDFVMEATYDHADPGVLFLDRINNENNLWYAEHIQACNPCGEQMLPAFGCCCLGSINLTEFVEQPFAEGAYFDKERFGDVVRTSIRMLDDVLDATAWPLPEQDKEAEAKRRVGLGYLGLGDALIMLGIRYDSEEGRAMAAEMSRVMRDESYRASVELAQEKGAFPLFDAEKYLQGQFVARLPDDIKASIREHGIRNSHLMSIAPTGTITLAFADNASNGIEPPFSWTYTRNKRMPDDTTQKFEVEDHAFRVWRQQGNDPGPMVEGRYANLPDQFVSALEMNVEDHMQMIAAVQPYIDSAISKTCNVPADYDYMGFRELYSRAWRAGAKGLTTFRPNDITGAVLETSHDSQQPSEFDQSDADRRLRLDKAPQPALASLRWQNRPSFPDGNPAKTYMVSHPGGKFAVFVGYVENGPNGDEKHPFEVWVNGAEQPRGAGAIAKALSMDMRTRDTAFLKAKLDSLAKVHDQAFELPMPPNGELQRVPSAVAAMAILVRHCCEELGVFERKGDTPVLDALMSPKEPKTGASGTMSWTVDVLNPATGDDFVLGIKELSLPDGERRPYSMWLAGEYPRALDGLCKVLSYDMRVIDPAWIGSKLRTLVDFPEAQGDFLAWVPGAHRQAVQPSTVAYIARLMIHRYHMLGILDEDGFPVQPMDVMFTDTGAAHDGQGDNVIPFDGLRAAGANEVTPGRRCGECGNYAMIKRDGCDFCTACGAQGGCG